MFGWFEPKCPLETSLKTWTEWRMRWLADTLGIDRLRKARVILPDDQFFPGEYHGTPEDAQRMFELLCGWMAVEPASIRLEVVSDREPTEATASDAVGIIHVLESDLEDPVPMVALLAHQLAREILLQDRFVTSDTPDHQRVIDLVPVYLGLGLFTANSSIIRRSIGSEGDLSKWMVQRNGYLPSHVVGYALALFAYMRGEGPAEWGRHLRPDARETYDKGLRYLRRSSDVLFHPDTIREPLAARNAEALRRRLEEGSPTLRLHTLWAVLEQPFGDEPLLAAVVNCLDHRDDAVIVGAVEVLGAWRGDLPAETVDRLLDLTARASTEVRAAAAVALGSRRQNPERVVPEVAVLLTYNNSRVRDAAITGLSQFGADARFAAKPIAGALLEALVKCEGEKIDVLADTLSAVFAESPELFDVCFEKTNPELRHLAEAALRESARRKRRWERSNAAASQGNASS